jgi:mannose-6-phosphate isomerase-like protein (cupin superfamily)
VKTHLQQDVLGSRNFIVDLEPRVPTLEQIHRLQREMVNFTPYEPQTEHYWADGMYCRKVPRPAGCLVVGKVHKREHFYLVAKGRVAVYGGWGEAKLYESGDVIVSEPGTRRVVYALEDSVCITVHRTETRDIAKIDDELVESDNDSWYEAGNHLKVSP